MPKFKKNTSPAMYKKPSSFKMNGFSGFGNSPMHKNWLDIKFKDVKKNISNKISNVKERIGNTTIRDVIKSTPEYKIYSNVKKRLNKNKPKSNNVSNAAKNAMRSLTTHGLMGIKKTIKRKTNTTVNTVKKLPVQKMPVADNTRMFTTPNYTNISKKKRS